MIKNFLKFNYFLGLKKLIYNFELIKFELKK